MIDPKEFKNRSEEIIRWIDHYLNHMATLPVKSQVTPGAIYKRIPGKAPQHSETLDSIMKDLNEIILPGVTHWQHPNFHAYFPANNSVESIYAEFLTSAIGAQCMIWDTSPAAAELEQRMMEWLKDAMNLPAGFEGVIQDSASSATLVALLTAREVKTGFRSNEEGVPNNLRVYCTKETHSSIEKAVGVTGIGKKNLIRVEVNDQLQMIPSRLEENIRADIQNGYKPCAVVGTVGTTGTLAVDPIDELGTICKKYGLWFHIDAAYAGTALLLPEYEWIGKGIGKADSFVFNPHKWMFTNFDCSAYYVKDTSLLLHTFEVLPEYLVTKTRGLVNDYRDWGVPMGRRFRALKLWFVLRSFGITGLQEKLRSHIRLNEFFSREIEELPGIVLPLNPFLNFTCFRLNPGGENDPGYLNRLNELLLETINGTGKLFLTHTKIGDLFTLRMIIGQTYVEKSHVDLALDVIQSAAKKAIKNC